MSNQREKFFAQYWGCNVLYVGGVGLQIVGHNGWNLRHPDFFLQLTPLSQISDEDNNYKGTYSKRSQKHLWSVEQADYLRSKGYALPWNGITVEEQIKLGWIKLKGNE